MNPADQKYMSIFIRIAASLFICLLGTVVHAEDARVPIAMDDFLNAEGFGTPVFAPDGQAFAFEREIPIAKQESWGYTYAKLVRSRVFVTRLDGSPPKEISNSAEVHYSLAPKRAWSPDGRELLLIAATRKGYGLAVYDLASGKVMRLPGYLDGFFPTFDWTQDGRIVYFALAEGIHQRGASSQVLENVTTRWSEAWNGGAPQVTVSSLSPVFGSSEPPPGTLMLADPQRGTSRNLASGSYYAIAVAPDGRSFAAVHGAEPMATSLNSHGRRGELQIFELDDTGARRLYQYDDLDVSARGTVESSLSWSPSGVRVLFVGAQGADGRANTQLYVVDIGDGKLQKLTSPGLSFISTGAGDWGTTLPVGWLTEHPVAVATHQAASSEQAPPVAGRSEAGFDYGEAQNLRFDVYAFGANGARNLTAFARGSVNKFLVPPGENHVLVIGDGTLWKLDYDQAPVELSPKGGPTIVDFGIDRHYPEPPLRSAYYRSGSVARLGLYASSGKGKPERVVLDLETGRLAPLKVKGGIAATAPDQIIALSRVAAGWSSSLLLNDGDARVVLSVNLALKDRAIAPAKSFHFTYEGKSLVGWVVMPLDAKKHVPQPAVVAVYGGVTYGSTGPPGASLSVSSFSSQLLAAEGYAVVYPSMPVGPGSSTNVMSTLAGEAVAAVDALAAQGIVDPKRVGVIGHSFGGYSTAAILAERSDRFQAGIAMAGIYDWMFGWGMLPMDKILTSDSAIFAPEITMIQSGQIGLGKPFWQSPDAYMRNSPIFRVEHMNAPLLLLHGDLDMGVSGLPGAERMYNALLMAGKTTTLVRYWGEGHVPQSAWAVRDQWSRIKTWFGQYLESTPPATR